MKNIIAAVLLAVTSIGAIGQSSNEFTNLIKNINRERITDDFLIVGNDLSIDSFEKVESYCEKKYPGFLLKSKNAERCIERIKYSLRDANTGSQSTWMPERRDPMRDYPNSEEEFYQEIKNRYSITNKNLIFNNLELKNISDYFNGIEQSIINERVNRMAAMDLREAQDKEREFQRNEEAKQKAIKEQAQAKSIAERNAIHRT